LECESVDLKMVAYFGPRGGEKNEEKKSSRKRSPMRSGEGLW